jgi:hypothetical protein
MTEQSRVAPTQAPGGMDTKHRGSRPGAAQGQQRVECLVLGIGVYQWRQVNYRGGLEQRSDGQLGG